MTQIFLKIASNIGTSFKCVSWSKIPKSELLLYPNEIPVSVLMSLTLCTCKTVVFFFLYKKVNHVFSFHSLLKISFDPIDQNLQKNFKKNFSLEVLGNVSSQNFSKCYRKPLSNQSIKNRLYWLIFRSYFVNAFLKMDISCAKTIYLSVFWPYFYKFLCKRKHIFWTLVQEYYFIVVAGTYL